MHSQSFRRVTQLRLTALTAPCVPHKGRYRGVFRSCAGTGPPPAPNTSAQSPVRFLDPDQGNVVRLCLLKEHLLSSPTALPPNTRQATLYRNKTLLKCYSIILDCSLFPPASHLHLLFVLSRCIRRPKESEKTTSTIR